MKDKQSVQNWFMSELLASFFESPTGLRDMLRKYESILKYSSPEVQELMGSLSRAKTDEETELLYEGLFYGTDCRYKIPLWTSACKNGPSMLLNETTLEVIRFYHKWGYTPEIIDGNPEDFIGTQLKFTAYLNACCAYEEEQGSGRAEEYRQAVRDFFQLSLIDTVGVMAAAVRKSTEDPYILGAVTLLTDFIFQEGNATTEITGEMDALFREIPSGRYFRTGEAPAIPDGERKIVKTGGFNNCGGKCVIHAHVQDGCVLNITTDNSENSPQVRACLRGRGYRYTYFSSDRLRYPMMRIGKRGEGRFRRVSWDKALDVIAENWHRTRDTYGPASSFVMYGCGITSMLRPDALIKRLLNLDGGFLGAYNTYSDACTMCVSPYIYGDIRCGNGVEDMVNTKFMILWGHNPAETIFGSERNYYLTKVKEKGIPVVVIDPRETETAITYGDEWIGLRPSTDSALADGMAYVIWTEGLMDKAFMDKFCIGFDKEHMPDGVDGSECYEAYLLGEKDGIAKTPEWASEITGVPAEKIRNLARAYATAKPACIMPGYGLQRTGNGEQTIRSLAMLAALTGNIGIPGGGSAGAGEEDGAKTADFPTGDNPYPGKIPNFLWSKAVDKGTEMTADDGLKGVKKLDSGIKMLFNLAGNTLINQHSNINDTIRILQDESKCECIVCSDIFMTPSAKFADILLPGSSVFENNNMTAPWMVGDYMIYNNQIRKPIFDTRFEWDWIRDLAGRLGYREAYDAGHSSMEDWIKDLYGQMRLTNHYLPDYEVIKARGIWKWKKDHPFIAFEDQIRDFEHHPFHTPSGKIEIYSQTLRDMGNPEEIPAIPRYVACPEGPEDPLRNKYPLQLIGWHTKRRTHTVHDNNPLMEEIAPQELWIHPADAEARDVREGELVRVYNDRGALEIKAHVTDRIVSGVCAMAQGAWYSPNADGVDTRGSINVLTSSDKPTPLAKGNPQHTNLVEVRKA